MSLGLGFSNYEWCEALSVLEKFDVGRFSEVCSTTCLLTVVGVVMLTPQSSNQQNSKFMYIDPLRLNLVTIRRKYLRFAREG